MFITSIVRLLAGTALTLTVLSAAKAQDAKHEGSGGQRITESATPSDTCLRRSSEFFYYPSAALKRDRGGIARLALTFRRPDAPPDVEVLTAIGGNDLLRAAKERVAQHRMPCLVEGAAPIRIVEDIRFDSTPREESHGFAPGADQPVSERRRELMRCLRTPEGMTGPSGSDFGKGAANVILQFTFTAPDAPPDIHVVYRSGPPDVLDFFKGSVSAWRLPCITAQDDPVVFQQQFAYRPDAERTIIADPLPLPAFLGSVKGIRTMVVKFNFDEMGCPFDVAWQFNMPAMPNVARQIGPAASYDARREPFLDWLKTLELDLTPERFERLLGKNTRIQVGCGTLNLSDD